MVDISTNEVNKYYGSNHVLKGITLEIYNGEKIGLLGRNGSGKTTLFKIIAGIETYESGTVSKASGKVIEMLAQIPIVDESDTAEDVLRSSFKEITEIFTEMKKIEGNSSPSILIRYGQLLVEYERLGGYEIEVKLCKVCNGMNIDSRILNSPFSRLSGGEKTRVNLARILLRDSDILLLDEPTNHLDIVSLEWLEKFLLNYPGTVVVVSHDRMFLDRVVKRIIEIECGSANFYSGNYSCYKEEKLRRHISQSERYQRQQKEIKRIEDRARWFVEQNRYTTKHHAILSRINHMEKIEQPVTMCKLTAKFEDVGYTAKEVVSFHSVRKSYDSRLILSNLNLKINRNERIALIGANGCGKTTFLKMIMGEEKPDNGEIKVNLSVKPAYLSQIITFDDINATVLDTLCYAAGVSTEKARSILACYHFTSTDVVKKVNILSGGEKSRLKLCIMMQLKINFLLLDEPTNHLDIASREWIENALADFDGTILFVSHDRYFINKFAEQVLSMENGVVTRYDCGFDKYLAMNHQTPLQVQDNTRKKATSKVKTQIYNKKSVPLENMIHEAEVELQRIETSINLDLNQADYVKLSLLYEEKSRVEEKINILYNEWIEDG